MVNVVMSHFIDLGVNDDHLKTDLEKPTPYFEAEVVTELPWQLDDTIIQCIQTAKAISLDLGNSLLLKRKAFTDFGKKALTKEVKVNPDTFLQMAIQLAFQRLHHKAGELDVVKRVSKQVLDMNCTSICKHFSSPNSTNLWNGINQTILPRTDWNIEILHPRTDRVLSLYELIAKHS